MAWRFSTRDQRVDWPTGWPSITTIALTASAQRTSAEAAALPFYMVMADIYATPNAYWWRDTYLAPRERDSGVFSRLGEFFEKPFVLGLMWGGFIAPAVGWWRLLVDLPMMYASTGDTPSAWASDFTWGSIAGSVGRYAVQHVMEVGVPGAIRDAIELGQDVYAGVEAVGEAVGAVGEVVDFYQTGFGQLFGPVGPMTGPTLPGVVSGPYLP